MPTGLSNAVKPPIHKYSTEEHIVGEWIDGKPVYEKTFSVEITSNLSHEKIPFMSASGVEVIYAKGVVGPFVKYSGYQQILYASGNDSENYINIMLTNGTHWAIQVENTQNTSMVGVAYITMRYYKT